MELVDIRQGKKTTESLLLSILSLPGIALYVQICGWRGLVVIFSDRSNAFMFIMAISDTGHTRSITGGRGVNHLSHTRYTLVMVGISVPRVKEW
jgi:hypothetical protein